MGNGDLEHNFLKEKIVHLFFLPFLCSGVPVLALGILKMLLLLCFRDAYNQRLSNLFPA